MVLRTVVRATRVQSKRVGTTLSGRVKVYAHISNNARTVRSYTRRYKTHTRFHGKSLTKAKNRPTLVMLRPSTYTHTRAPGYRHADPVSFGFFVLLLLLHVIRVLLLSSSSPSSGACFVFTSDCRARRARSGTR